MGLDMYLNRTKRLNGVDLMNLDPDSLKISNPDLFENLTPFMVKRGNPDLFSWNSYHEKVGYWRKANHIHKWFVDNVQNGEDECQPHEVSKYKIEELRDICKTVLENSELIDSMVSNGTTLENGEWKPILVEGRAIADHGVAEKLLPTTDGFFFGGTDYSEWYLEDVEYTLDLCDQILRDFDFDEYVLFYQSSW